MREINFTDPNPPWDRRNDPEKILLLVTPGKEGHWGELEPLRGTSWEQGVEVISAESYSHALHGYLLPLQRELGRDPQASARRVLTEEGECALQGTCPTWNAKLCRPGGRLKREEGPPGCYAPPLASETSQEVLGVFMRVAQAWKEGRHTIVVVGEGFNIG